MQKTKVSSNINHASFDFLSLIYSKIAGIFEEESATDKIPVLKTKEQHAADRERK